MSIKSAPVAVYDQPHQFEPLLPSQNLAELGEATRRIFEMSAALRASASPEARSALREIVRSMNSYYSNRIESQSTHPFHIESALSKGYAGAFSAPALLIRA